MNNRTTTTTWNHKNLKKKCYGNTYVVEIKLLECSKSKKVTIISTLSYNESQRIQETQAKIRTVIGKQQNKSKLEMARITPRQIRKGLN